MKLIIAHHNLNERGGAERVILKIAQRYDAKIYTLGYDKSATFEEFGELDVNVVGKRSGLGSALPERVSNAVHYGMGFYSMKIKEDYDAINAHASPSEWIRNKNRRVLWYCHTPPRELYDLKSAGARKKSVAEQVMYGALSRVYSIEEKRIVSKLEAIATNSENTNSRLIKYLSRGGTVINPGIDYDRFANNGDDRYFLYPSRIAQPKRQEYVIGAFDKFMRKTGNSRYRLIIAGSVSKRYTDFVKYFERLKAMKVKNVVFRQNPTDEELIRLYSNSTAVLFSAMNEDFGIVPLEAMASSKPIISVNEGGPKETIVNGKTGFLVNSADEMADRMKFLVEHGSLSDTMGRAGRKRVVAKYSWSSFFKKFDPLVRKVGRM
jgi:glycosyltransferase involved in cell wall biosynthesis